MAAMQSILFRMLVDVMLWNVGISISIVAGVNEDFADKALPTG